MRLQLLSDLHLESEVFEPEPATGADLLVLAGDIDSRWEALDRFRGWPVPVLFVAGNHEFDRRDLAFAWPALRERCARLGLVMLERESRVLTDTAGLRVRFVATIRWCDFDLFGPARREPAMRASRYFMDLMRATRDGMPFDAAGVRLEALECRDWLQTELARPPAGWDITVAITHFGPSFASADPRYGSQSTTASFCNADDDLLPLARLWLHGHVHCRRDYRVEHAAGVTRVLSNPRGHSHNGEAEGYDGGRVFEVGAG